MFNQLYIPRINHIWLWYVILFIYCYICPANNMLRRLAPILTCKFLILSLTSFVIKEILASELVGKCPLYLYFLKVCEFVLFSSQIFSKICQWHHLVWGYLCGTVFRNGFNSCANFVNSYFSWNLLITYNFSNSLLWFIIFHFTLLYYFCDVCRCPHFYFWY